MILLRDSKGRTQVSKAEKVKWSMSHTHAVDEFDDEEEDFELGFGSSATVNFNSERKSSSGATTSDRKPAKQETDCFSYGRKVQKSQLKSEMLVMEELDDFDADFDDFGGSNSKSKASSGLGMELKATGEPISETVVDVETANALRKLAFGDERQAFNDAWQQQGFTFVTEVPELGYGLIQFEGGPCGVMAAVQAFVLKELLFSSNSGIDFRQPTVPQQNSALVKAIAAILWQAGDHQECVVALPRGRAKIERSTAYKPDGITEKLHMYTFDTKESLEGFIWSNIREFTSPKGAGAVSLVYSAMLSRGLRQVEGDMDGNLMGEVAKLMSQHGYAAQEMVNLLLVGRAHSNVFDGEQVMEGEGDDVIRLRGIPRRSTLGFLTLFEAYQYVAVGSNYKVPDFPIWVICSESHYSTLFSPDPNFVGKDGCTEAFDIYYFDGLANQDEVICLTVDQGNRYTGNDDDDKDLTPPIDKVIRTKWKCATVDWNGSEPIL
mmetsp:Transcript_35118/g.44367  ORF Transcript_35118/g.44367 Transcript_35118/m.44367 type:complete len:492 (-) Transcript_35118:40-1515(-)